VIDVVHVITLITAHHVDTLSTIPTTITVLRVRHVKDWDLKLAKQVVVSLCPSFIQYKSLHIEFTLLHACVYVMIAEVTNDN